MNRIAFFFLTCLLFFSACKLRVSTAPADKIIETLQKEYAPDKRVAVWNISTSPRGQTIVLRGETNLPETRNLLLEKLREAQIQYDDQIHILPDTELGDSTFGIVRLSVCNIRSRAKHSAELATQALLGTPLRLLKKTENGDWFYVQTPDNYLGWLDKDAFHRTDQKGLDQWLGAEKIIIQSPWAAITAAPDAQSPGVSDAVFGGILRKTGATKGFVEVAFPDGRTGFVAQKDQRPYRDWLAQPPATPEAILATAKMFVGYPYLWGGTSSKAFDCSGFTKTVFYRNGIQLSRDASQQVNLGEDIPTDSTWQNLQPADLLFFGTKTEEREKITHVAIYMGGGKIIHAAGLVKIESLIPGQPDFAEDRYKSFIRAKRILGADAETSGIIRLQNHPLYAPPAQ
ncbi:MAG: glycoside hydrolase [Bacteroidetes bacterium]|nr:MAG: glycoside hydrolase [Bacteroidota bacterium]